MFPKILLVLVSVWATAWSHGRLVEPPGRSTMWRHKYGGFPTEPNYDDDALWCGGRYRQWEYNGGKCGICGDAWDDVPPRDNEDGGKYGKKIIVRKYQSGQVIEAKVELTKHHGGYFEFRLCPMTHEGQITDQECLDRYALPLADSSGTRYTLPNDSSEGTYAFKLKLPEDLTCQRCVFQWHYKTANHWGVCPDKTARIGCGDEEYFRGCADVAIFSDNDIASLKNEKPRYKKPPMILQAMNIPKRHYQSSDKPNSVDDDISVKRGPNSAVSIDHGKAPCQP